MNGHKWEKDHYDVQLLKHLQDIVLIKHVRNLHANGKKDPFYVSSVQEQLPPAKFIKPEESCKFLLKIY